MKSPPRTARQVLERLVEARILAETVQEDDIGYVPARPPESLSPADILTAMRSEKDLPAESRNSHFADLASDLLERTEAFARRAFDKESLASLVRPTRSPIG
ncbi:MAG: hypothetical protein HC923_04120 [Myxococcales bacterium]|nr:hypothetical protein [Myxococcales bacterium]